MAVVYDVLCLKCDHVHEQTHSMKEAHAPCPKCKSKNVTTAIGNTIHFNPALDQNWENLNGGKGQYFSGMETEIRDPNNGSANCYFRSRNDALEACKRRGFNIISK